MSITRNSGLSREDLLNVAKQFKEATKATSSNLILSHSSLKEYRLGIKAEAAEISQLLEGDNGAAVKKKNQIENAPHKQELKDHQDQSYVNDPHQRIKDMVQGQVLPLIREVMQKNDGRHKKYPQIMQSLEVYLSALNKRIAALEEAIRDLESKLEIANRENRRLSEEIQRRQDKVSEKSHTLLIEANNYYRQIIGSCFQAMKIAANLAKDISGAGCVVSALEVSQKELEKNMTERSRKNIGFFSQSQSGSAMENHSDDSDIETEFKASKQSKPPKNTAK